MKTLILYSGDTQLWPAGFDRSLLESAESTHLDCGESSTDITAYGWWNKVPSKFDMIVDTIGPNGSHILQNCYTRTTKSGFETPSIRYIDNFMFGIYTLLSKDGKLFGHV